MKLPRDVDGEDLSKRLLRLGYQVTRQTGSHVRLTRAVDAEHHVTIPRHGVLKVGTLNSILKDVAEHLRMKRDELIRLLWE